MTIDKAIEHGKEQLEIFGGEHKEFIETAIETMRKYQKIRRTDIVTMLEDLQLEIEETVKEEELIDKEWANGLHYSEKIIQQKIDALRKVVDNGNVD